MPFYEKGPVRIHYEEGGEGYPLLLIAGGGLNATIGNFTGEAALVAPFNPLTEFSGQYRCITMDLRNANGGESTGPVDIERTWDSYTDDHLGLMDHLGIDKFMVMGFCIGGPFIWNMRYRERADFVFTVDRKFVRNCETPILILPDDIPAHPYAVAMEAALLAPNAETSLYPWKDAPQRTRLAVRHVQTFLRANCPAG